MIAGCAQFDSDVGSNISSEDLSGVLHDTTLYIDTTAISVLGDVHKYTSANLSLGHQAGITSDFVLSFTNFSALGDSILSLDTARLQLFASGLVDSAGAEDTTAWSAVMYWYSDVAPETTFTDTSVLVPLDTFEIGTFAKLDSFYLDLNADSVRTWIERHVALEQAEEDAGEESTAKPGITFRFRPNGTSSFLKNFVSNRGSNANHLPMLQLTGTYLSDSDTLRDSTMLLTAQFSAYMVDDTTTIPENFLALSDGYARRMLFWRSLDMFDPTIHSLNKAELRLHADTDTSRIFGSVVLMTAYEMDNDWVEYPDSADYGTVSSLAYTISDDTSLVRLDITLLVRYWIADPTENLGVGVRSYSEYTSIGRRLFYGPGADEALRPSIRIIYTEFEEQ